MNPFRKSRRPGNSDPTPVQAARMTAAKNGPCIPCLSGVMGGVIEALHACRGGYDGQHERPMMEYNHTKSGNIRRGHGFGFATCLWHHHGSQQLHALGLDYETAYARWGPNLFDQAKVFHFVFGTDDDLIELQTEVLNQREAA
jgi:hypothetical protein